MLIPSQDNTRNLIGSMVNGYAWFLLIVFSLAPTLAIGYLQLFQNSALLYEDHRFHEIAITGSILASGFITFVTWRCYQHSGETFLRWLTLGFLGFTLIYAPHGLFTSYAHENIWLFIFFGPVSRIVMLACFLVGLTQYGKPAEPVPQRKTASYWWGWIAALLVVDLAVAAFAFAPANNHPETRLIMEYGALSLAVIAIALMLIRQVRSSLMTIYLISLAAFAQASVAFILGAPWNHMWWLAHAIFAAGFFLLSYGVVQAFRTTRSFLTVYSQVELMAQLQRANKDLEKLAATDSLTGAYNRREFMRRAAVELARARRSGIPLSLLALDIDFFKSVNDRYGHQAGDDILAAIVNRLVSTLRPSDIIGRIGGEEFMILLPDTTCDGARIAAERMRGAIEQLTVSVQATTTQVTASIGVAQFGVDGDTYETCAVFADQRLHQAKQAGRNCVVA